jgi:hypothetical protein
MSKKYRIPVWGSTNLKGIRRKKHRFPVKSDELFRYLDEYQIGRITKVVYQLRTSREVLISVRYEGESLEDRVRFFGSNIDHFRDRIGKSTIQVYSVRPEEEEIARSALVSDALPLMCEWLIEAEKQTYNWRRNDHSIIFRFKDKYLSLGFDEKGHW